MKQWLLWVLVLFAAWRGYAHFVDRPSQADALAAASTRADVTASRAAPTAAPATVGFTCDGRQYCSQMASRAEAEFFVRHCPNIKMDGDGDGQPCENDSRF